jgi:hypothetical protein
LGLGELALNLRFFSALVPSYGVAVRHFGWVVVRKPLCGGTFGFNELNAVVR